MLAPSLSWMLILTPIMSSLRSAFQSLKWMIQMRAWFRSAVQVTPPMRPACTAKVSQKNSSSGIGFSGSGARMGFSFLIHVPGFRSLVTSK